MAAGIHSLRRLAYLACAALASAPLLAAILAEEATLEYQVKAAFLLNFTKFIEWPPGAFSGAGDPFAICILGKDPFGRALDDIVEGEAVGARKLTIRRISEAPAPRTCQMLFIGPGEKEVSRTLEALGPGVLTVGEGDEFSRDGGVIAFVIDNRRVRFDINVSAAGRAGLKLSSRLLSVARAIEK
jgi:hypothetical protein